MVVFNPSKREIGAKIVFYGPAACGKTTNLQYVHRRLNPNQRGELISLATKDDRTLFFDFLPLDVGSVKGFKTRFHLYTVPGQVYYVSTRRAVLTGVDGVVFVADSQESKLAENIESLEDLEKNLHYYGKKIEEIPMILQYNKRDLKRLTSVEVMNEKLNSRDLPFIEAVASNGKGVMETLTMITRLVLGNLEDSSRKSNVLHRKNVAGKSTADVVRSQTPPPIPDLASVPTMSVGARPHADLLQGRLREKTQSSVEALLEEETIDESLDESIMMETSTDSNEYDKRLECDEEEIPARMLDQSDVDEEVEIPDEQLDFGEVEEDTAADTGTDDSLGVSEFGDEGSPDAEEPLEFDEIDLDGQESPDPRLEPEEPLLDFDIPNDDLELEPEPEEYSVALEVEEDTNDLELEDYQEGSESAGESDLADKNLNNMLQCRESGHSAPEAKTPGADGEIEIVACGKAELVSRGTVRIPLTLKIKQDYRELHVTLTVQLEETLKYSN